MHKLLHRYNVLIVITKNDKKTEKVHIWIMHISKLIRISIANHKESNVWTTICSVLLRRAPKIIFRRKAINDFFLVKKKKFSGTWLEVIVVQIHIHKHNPHIQYISMHCAIVQISRNYRFRAITFGRKDKTNFHIESADFRYQRILILRINSPGCNFLFTMMQSHKVNAEKYHTGKKMWWKKFGCASQK